MKHINLYFLSFFCLLQVSCQSKTPYLSINANLKNISDSSLFYLQDFVTHKNIDTAYVINGSLYLKGKLPHPQKLFLFATDAKSKEFIYTFLFAGNDQITFKADKKVFPVKIFHSYHIFNFSDNNHVNSSSRDNDNICKTTNSSNNSNEAASPTSVRFGLIRWYFFY